MATTVATLVAKLQADTRQFDTALSSSESKMKKIGRVAGIAGAALAGGLLFGAKNAINAATSQEEAINKATVTFGRSADAILNWSRTTGRSMGIARTQSLSAASGFGALFQEAGQAPPVAAKFSKSMVKAAADLGSFHDVDPTEVLESLRSGLAGESEPLRRFNIFMSDATIKAFAYKNGIAETGTELTENQKILARQGFILSKIGKAQDDFAETSGSAANQQRIQKAMAEDLNASLGRALLPTWRAVQSALISVTGWMAENQGATKAIIAAVAILSAGLLTLAASVKIAALANVVFGASLNAIPIFAVITGIILLGTALVIAYKKSETFRKVVHGVINFVKKRWELLLLAIFPLATLFITLWKRSETFRTIVRGALDVVRAAVDRLRTALTRVRDFLSFVRNTARFTFEFFRDKAQLVVDKVQAILKKLKEMVEFIKDIPGKVRGALEKLGGLFGKVVPFVGEGLGALGDGLVGAFRRGPRNVSPSLYDELAIAQRGGLTLTSSYRPGAITSSGNPSLHGMFPSKAIDMAGSYAAMRRVFWALVGRSGIREMFLSPWGYLPGVGVYRTSGALRADHWDHVHIGSFDRGGFLKPGWNLAWNGLNRPEPVGAGNTYNFNGAVLDGDRLLRFIREEEKKRRRRGGA